MLRRDFTHILSHFSNTIGREEKPVVFYKYQFTGEMGMTGGELTKYKTRYVILLINQGDGVNTSDGKQRTTGTTSIRTTEPDLANTYFYYQKKRYKVLNVRDINGTLNGKRFYHYDCVEG